MATNCFGEEEEISHSFYRPCFKFATQNGGQSKSTSFSRATARPEYGNSPIGERCVEVVRKRENPNTTLNMLVSLNGVEYFNLIDGATNTAEFLNFFEGAADAANMTTLRPVLEIGDIIVMDNLNVHHYNGGEILEDFLAESGIELLYTPVYSPDLNPIEMCFNKVKTSLNHEYNDLVHNNVKLAGSYAVETITQDDTSSLHLLSHTSFSIRNISLQWCFNGRKRFGRHRYTFAWRYKIQLSFS